MYLFLKSSRRSKCTRALCHVVCGLIAMKLSHRQTIYSIVHFVMEVIQVFLSRDLMFLLHEEDRILSKF